MRTIDDVINSIEKRAIETLPAPPYVSSKKQGIRLGLAVASMANHTTDEGWQLFQALEQGGYNLAGRGIVTRDAVISLQDEKLNGLLNLTDVRAMLGLMNLDTIVLQDKREWEGITAGGKKTFDESERFTNVELLKDRNDIFKLTVLKDAQSNPLYHRQSAEEIGCHAWIVYYHPRIVKRLAPYVREEHLIRTYHTVDSQIIPEYSEQGRRDCLLSGALSGAYPLRQKLVRNLSSLANITFRPHPGYHRNGCDTPNYLKLLSKFKVAICTSSIYGYALRKIIEATACGCRVITDLPVDEVLPEIDDNLVRVDTGISIPEIRERVATLARQYDPLHQRYFSDRCKWWYDYRMAGVRLSHDIEIMRCKYGSA